MKKNVLKRTVALTLAGTMVLGSGLVAGAAGLENGTLSGTGGVEYLMNLDVMSYEVTTDRAADKIFNFILDPQQVIKDTAAQDDSPYKNKITTEGTLYFPNAQNDAAEAADAVLGNWSVDSKTQAEASESIKVEIASDLALKSPLTYKAAVTAGWYKGDAAATGVTITVAGVELAEGDKVVAKYPDVVDSYEIGGVSSGLTVEISDAENNTTYLYKEAKAAGWYDADGTAAETGDVTLTGLTAAVGDTIAFTPATAATDVEYKYSPTSDMISATNKGFVAANVSLTATISDLGDTVKMNSAADFGTTNSSKNTKPEIYLAVVSNTVDKTGTAGTAVTTPFADGGTTSYAFGELAANAVTDFDTKYYPAETNAEGEVTKAAYYGKVAKEDIENTKYTFQLTGAANPDGEWVQSLADIAPKINLVWDLKKKNNTGVTMTMSNKGVVTVTGTTKDVNISTMELFDEKGFSLGHSTVASDMTWGVENWSAEEGGDFTMTMPASYLEYWDGVKVTAKLTLTDGSTIISTPVIIEK